MELSEIRKHIDRLDRALLIIMAERFSFIPKVAEYKRKNKMEVHQSEREKMMLQHRKELAKELGLRDEFVEQLFTIIIEESKRIQEGVMNKDR